MDPKFESAKNSRTPVAWVQEICAKQGNQPHWDIIDVSKERGSQLPLFKATVTLTYKDMKLTAEAEYRNKKEVKQHAAKKMLDDCMQLTPMDYWELAGCPKPPITAGYDAPSRTTPIQHINNDPVLSSHPLVSDTVPTFDDGDIGVNPISDLALLCENLNLGPPDYDTEAGSDGPAHNKRFAVDCKIANESKTEWSKTKKQAKRRVAHKWLLALKGAPTESPRPEERGCDNRESVNTNTLCDQVNFLKLHSSRSFRSPCSGTIEDCLKVVSHQNHIFQKMSGELISKLKEEDVYSLPNCDPEKYLEDMGKENNFTIQYTPYQIPETFNYSAILLLTVQFAADVQVVQFGVGNTEGMARKQAAVNVLQHIQTVAR